MLFTWLGKAIALLCLLYGLFDLLWTLTGQYGPAISHLADLDLGPGEVAQALNEVGMFEDVGDAFRLIAFGVALGVLTEISQSLVVRTTNN
ncbi:hypothetical protein [Gymnodinialimonas sp. 57CJ19]|uniref:hypothetical protein n=1 Tax=Gymnodinialimonas sp. 57CJ19 TaxID=3138498 RepID=UPI003134512B